MPPGLEELCERPARDTNRYRCEVIRGEVEPDLPRPKPEGGCLLPKVANLEVGPGGQQDELAAVELQFRLGAFRHADAAAGGKRAVAGELFPFPAVRRADPHRAVQHLDPGDGMGGDPPLPSFLLLGQGWRNPGENQNREHRYDVSGGALHGTFPPLCMFLRRADKGRLFTLGASIPWRTSLLYLKPSYHDGVLTNCTASPSAIAPSGRCSLPSLPGTTS
jgi:hypothetical protein